MNDSRMKTYHIMYTLNGVFHSEMRDFLSFRQAESWLECLGATHWEIGMADPVEIGLTDS